jgi:hypothetical protein
VPVYFGFRFILAPSHWRGIRTAFSVVGYIPTFLRPSDVQQGGNNLARSNYSFQKRQKELARMKKKEEKRKRKLEKNNPPEEETPEQERTQ